VNLRPLTVADLEAVFELWDDKQQERSNEQTAAKELVRRAMPDGTTTADVERMPWVTFTETLAKVREENGLAA
jgi:hypothetical protein